MRVWRDERAGGLRSRHRNRLRLLWFSLRQVYARHLRKILSQGRRKPESWRGRIRKGVPRCERYRRKELPSGKCAQDLAVRSVVPGRWSGQRLRQTFPEQRDKYSRLRYEL